MEIKTLYKVITGTSAEIEETLNAMSQQGWRPVTMSSVARPSALTVILENKIMEEAKLTLASALIEAPAAILEEVQ